MERITWTDELIESQIRFVMSALGIERMPSNSEIIAVLGNTALTNAVRRRGGFYKRAALLGIPLKDSGTKTGDVYELYAMATMTSKGFPVKRMSVRHPFDLLVNKCVKVDVKASTAYMNQKSLVNTVRLGKVFATCDIYIIYLLHPSGELDRTLIIPSHLVKQEYLNIGKDSKYNIYQDRWDYLTEYGRFMQELIV